jgi:outer membrane protein OmpA-like peptidoglycan-associated protein
VKDYMVAQGIASSRVEVVSYGKSRPVASNDTAEGRARNRRVDIVVE